MFRAVFGSILVLAMAGPALAAAEIETCRDAGATSEARLVACSAVILGIGWAAALAAR